MQFSRATRIGGKFIHEKSFYENRLMLKAFLASASGAVLRLRLFIIVARKCKIWKQHKQACKHKTFSVNKNSIESGNILQAGWEFSFVFDQKTREFREEPKAWVTELKTKAHVKSVKFFFLKKWFKWGMRAHCLIAMRWGTFFVT